MQSNTSLQENCIFCQIANGKVISKKVYEDDNVIGVLDIHPANKGHVLLFPKQHFPIMPLVSKDVRDEMFVVSKKISNVVLRVLGAKGTNIFIANGISAGQKAQHFLLHIIPRYENDNVGINIVKNKLENLEVVKEKLLSELEGKVDVVENKDEENEETDVEDDDSDDEEDLDESNDGSEEVEEDEGNDSDESSDGSNNKVDLDEISRMFR